MEEVQQGTPVSPLNFLFPILHLRHVIHIMYGECSLQPLTHDEFSLVEQLMARGFSFPSSEEFLKQRKSEGERKLKRLLPDTSHIDKVTRVYSTPSVPFEPSPSKSSVKRARMNEKEGVVTLTIPSDALAYSNPSFF